MCLDLPMECFRIQVGMCPDFLEPVDDRAIESFSGGLATSRSRVMGLRPSSADSRVAERSPRQGTGQPWLWARCDRGQMLRSVILRVGGDDREGRTLVRFIPRMSSWTPVTFCSGWLVV
jgi:hypothetical protein